MNNKIIMLRQYSYIALCFVVPILLGVLVRLFVLMNVDVANEYQLDNHFMPMNVDAYHWLTIARDIGINGGFDIQILYGNGLPIVTYFISKLNFIETGFIVQYMPMFLSLLLIIPIIMMSKLFSSWHTGSLAASLSVIAPGYLNRTLASYFDTDMLNVVLPLFAAYCFINFLLRQRHYWCLLGLFLCAFNFWWYPSSIFINVMMFTLTLLLMVKENYKLVIPYALIGLVFMIVFGDNLYAFLDDRLNQYFNIQQVANANSYINFVGEMQTPTWSIFTQRVIGNLFLLLVGLLFYCRLIYKNTVFIVLLPMLLLGLSAFISGLRFTMYATPVVCMGLAYGIHSLWRYFVTIKGYNSIAVGMVCSVLMGTSFWSSLVNANTRQVSSVFTAEEAIMLRDFGEKLPESSQIISWYDYGYGLAYFTKAKAVYTPGSAVEKLPKHISAILVGTKLNSVKSALASLNLEHDNIFIYLSNDLIKKTGVLLQFNQRLNNPLSAQKPLFRYHRNMEILFDGKLEKELRKGRYRLSDDQSVQVNQLIELGLDQRITRKQFPLHSKSPYCAITTKWNQELLIVDDSFLDTLFFKLHFLKQTLSESYTVAARSKSATLIKVL